MPTPQEKITAAADLVAKWRDRCLELAKRGKYPEAARLDEAANEMMAALGPNPYSEAEPAKLSTDDMIRDAYERAKRPTPLDQVSPPPTVWPAMWLHTYEPIPGIYPATRVVD